MEVVGRVGCNGGKAPSNGIVFRDPASRGHACCGLETHGKGKALVTCLESSEDEEEPFRGLGPNPIWFPYDLELGSSEAGCSRLGSRGGAIEDGFPGGAPVNRGGGELN